ncbi:uncharacterized protein LOC135847244 [Planococcus citri]|uniref:uncharacterized protein LOC135847244 n=1 Tax=Planococcus citri TaxID=170843 RepID=UPI0031F76A65
MFSDKHVLILSGISGILNLITCVAVAITWTYWSNTLNTCTGSGNCECVLYGEIRGSSFVGGTPLGCRTVTYTSLALTIVSFAVAAVYLIKIRNSQPGSLHRSAQSEEAIAQKRFTCRNKQRFPLLLKIVAGIVTLLMFVEAITLSEGYWQTCNQYKTIVNKVLRASGDLSDLVMDRFSCSTMYDFMDFLQPDPILRYPYTTQYYYPRRTTRINTGYILLASVIFSWISVALWSAITIFVGFCKYK